MMLVFRPDGSIKAKQEGHFFTRVFYPATPEDFLADPCGFWNDESLIIAEGITHATWHDYLVDGKPVINPFDVEMLPPGIYRLVESPTGNQTLQS